MFLSITVVEMTNLGVSKERTVQHRDDFVTSSKSGAQTMIDLFTSQALVGLSVTLVDLAANVVDVPSNFFDSVRFEELEDRSRLNIRV